MRFGEYAAHLHGHGEAKVTESRRGDKEKRERKRDMRVRAGQKSGKHRKSEGVVAFGAVEAALQGQRVEAASVRPTGDGAEYQCGKVIARNRT